MSQGPSLPDVTVTGGAGGVEARFDDLERLGRLYAETGGRLAEAAWDDKLEAADGDLLASAILSPGTFADAEQAILRATYGPDGLVASALVVEGQALVFTAVADLYRAADAVQREAFERLSYGLGYAAGLSLPALLVSGGLTWATLDLLGLEPGDDELADLVAFLEDNPALLETLVNGGGGLLDGLGAHPLTGIPLDLLGIDGFPPDTGSAADDLGELLFGDYEGDLSDTFPTDVYDFDAPQDLDDLLADLADVGGGDDGVVTVQQVTAADGSTSYIVQLPGTDDFLDEDGIRNMGSNLNLIAGDDTAYGDAVAQALAAAGVPSDAPLMLVGHSQGGMQAAALAADPDFGFDVTHVVTAGSPIATSGVPDDVQVLSLENTGDVVPLLDGEPNPGSANHTTVTADVHSGSFGAQPGQNHSLEVYAAIAAAAEAGGHPSVEHLVADLHAQGFLGGTGSVTQSFQTQVGDQVRPPDQPALAEALGG